MTRVLCIDDDNVQIRLLNKFFSNIAERHSAKNGIEAVKLFTNSIVTQEYYDLICLDVIMPELDGYSTLKVIRTLEQVHHLKPTRIVMMTDVSEAEFKKELGEDFAYDKYVHKPVTHSITKKILTEFNLYEYNYSSL